MPLDTTIIPMLVDMAAFLAAGIYTSFMGRLLFKHLEEHAPERWSYLRTEPGVMTPPFRFIHYVFSRDDDENETIRVYKKKVRTGLKAILLAWIAIPVASLVLFLTITVLRFLHPGSYPR